MGNLFTPGGNTSGNIGGQNIVSNPDNTRVSYNVGKYFNKVNKIKKPNPQSVNKPPKNFNKVNISKGMSLDQFFNNIGQKESGNRYNITGQVMKSGMHKGHRAMGKYQFMPSTLKGLGYNLTEKQFLSSPKIQEEAMRKLTYNNARSLGFSLGKNLTAQQVKLLSMAHYSGIGNAKKYMQSGGYTRQQREAQWGTGTRHDSIQEYADSIVKNGSLNKVLYIFNKLIKGE